MLRSSQGLDMASKRAWNRGEQNQNGDRMALLARS